MFEKAQRPDQNLHIKQQQEEKNGQQKKQKAGVVSSFFNFTPNNGTSDFDPIQKKETESNSSTSTNNESSKSGLPNEVNSKMESAFGTSFKDVSIHTNDKSATGLGALAYTQGKDVHFAPGQFNPNSKKGQELLGHELTHVVQQKEGRVNSPNIGDLMPSKPIKSEKQLKREELDRDYRASRTGDPTAKVQFQLKHGKEKYKSDLTQRHYNQFAKGELKQLKRNKHEAHTFRSKTNAFERQLKRDNISFGSEEYIQRAKNFFPGFDPVSPLLKADPNFQVNEDIALEQEADVMGKKAAEGNVVDVSGRSQGIQKKEDDPPANTSSETTINSTQPEEQETQSENELANNESNPSTTTSFSSDIYIVKNDASIRDDTEAHAVLEGNPKIPQWTKVVILETSTDNKRYKTQKHDDVNSVWWTSISNCKETTNANDADSYTAFYNDIAVLSAPGQTESNINIEVNKKYIIVSKLECQAGNYTLVRKEGEAENSGWVNGKNFTYNFHKGAKVTRQEELKKYKIWLEARLAEAKEKPSDDQISFIQGILYQSEVIAENIGKETPEYPNTETLNKTPSFSESENTAKGISIPHELIGTLRQFIEITELKPVEEAESTTTEATAPATGQESPTSEVTATETPTLTNNTESVTENTTTENRIVGGSRHSNIDWNTRLKVPQYRTQSDNLAYPEGTCNVTTFSMTMERIGNNRSNIISAIDEKLKEGVESPDLKELWESKTKAYLENENTKGSKSLRNNQGGLSGKEDELSKKFKDIAQMEDLVDFYLYLKSISRYSLVSSSINTKSVLENLDESTSNDSVIIKYSWNNKVRNKIKETLDNGGAVALSIRHKSNQSSDGSHIISVQSIESDGLVVDDPYGGHASDYLRKSGQTGDLFAGKNKTIANRNGLEFKNKKHLNANETNYNNRDFTAEAAQNLEADESRGGSVKLPFSLINNSDKSFINYIAIYEK